MLYCRLIYMLSMQYVRLKIKVKVGIPESFKVGWYRHKITGSSHLNLFLQYSGCNVRCLYRQCGKLGLSMTSISRVFVLGKCHPRRAFPLLEDSEFFLMLSLRVILRSCIASLKVLNYSLEDHLKKVYDCVRFIQIIIIPMVWADFAHSRCP